MQENNQANVKNILLRVADVLKVRGIRGLASALEIPEGTVYAWIKRGSIGDTGAILSKCPNINALWLIGESDQMLRGSAAASGLEVPEGGFKIPAPSGQIPIISWAQAGQEGYFEDSYPAGAGFGYINRPYDLSDPAAYALIISGDSMSPKFEPGDVVIVSPAAMVTTGDYAVVKLNNGEVTAKRIKDKNGSFVLESVNTEYEPRTVAKENISFIHRIVWVKQRG